MKLSILISLIAVIQAVRINPEDNRDIQMLSKMQEASLSARMTDEEREK